MLDDTRDPTELVAESREILTADYDGIVRTQFNSIYRKLIAFANKVDQKFTLEGQENFQLRNVCYVARDSRLIVGVVAQLGKSGSAGRIPYCVPGDRNSFRLF